MKSTTSLRCLAAIVLLSIPGSSLLAQVVVEGLTDRTVYVDQVSIRVPTAAGTTTTALLNGSTFPVGPQTTVAGADYYELEVERKNDTSGAVTTGSYQFIIRSSERRSSEWGLRPWVPYPSIPSADAEFAGAHLVLLAPSRFPAGLPIPVVIWVEDAGNQRVGVNGAVTAAGQDDLDLFLRRGVGSGYLVPGVAGVQVAFAPAIGGLTASHAIDVDATTTWTTASGTLAASATWAEDARVEVTADLTVPAGMTLTIGAGAVVRLRPGVELQVNGTLRVEGTLARPAVFLPATAGSPWGGINFRGAAAVGAITGGIFTGSGADPDWFDNNAGSGSSHRGEQPCLYLSGGARVDVVDSALLDGGGQAGHGEASFLTLHHTLVQRFITCGQYNGGSLKLQRSAAIEFPRDGAPFADADNDAIYMTGGSHSISDSLVGWSLDDGLDAGSGAAGPVTVTNCWIESTYHEGMAWSEDRLPTVRGTVATNCGQGIECGFGSPDVVATDILSTANFTGARFGDNYDWDYNGTLNVTGSLLLHNFRDVWGRAWDDWSYHTSQMTITGNHVTQANPQHPQNTIWDPARDAALLEPFLPTPATEVGIGLALRQATIDLAEIGKGIPVRLSTFTTHQVSVDYTVETSVGPGEGGVIVFEPGETLKRIVPALPEVASLDFARLTLGSAVGGVVTGQAEVEYIKLIEVTLVPEGAVWRFNDTNNDLKTAWRSPGYNDAGWSSGPAQLGFGEDDQATPINGGPSNARYPTIYFRHRFTIDDPSRVETLKLRLLRDDGAVVYLNGVEVIRSNMPEGTITHATHASDSADPENVFLDYTVPAANLVVGDNVIAVELHQVDATSSDLSFDLELIAVSRSGPVVATFVRGDANQDARVDISDALKILFYLFAGASSTCPDALDGDDSGDISLTDAIYLLRYLFQGGDTLPAPFPAVGADPTQDTLGCE